MSSSAYVEKAGRLVVDANIALGVILSGASGSTRRLVRRLEASGIALLAPQELIREVETHFANALARSLERRGITGAEYKQAQQDAADLWSELQSTLRFVPSREYQISNQAHGDACPLTQMTGPMSPLRCDSIVES